MLYLARDKNGMLGCYSVKPTKGETKWEAGLIKNFVGFVYSDEYDNIKWEDEEPTELICKTQGEIKTNQPIGQSFAECQQTINEFVKKNK